MASFGRTRSTLRDVKDLVSNGRPRVTCPNLEPAWSKQDSSSLTTSELTQNAAISAAAPPAAYTDTGGYV